jgi:hypothetical protein
MSGRADSLLEAMRVIAEFRNEEKKRNGCETRYAVAEWSEQKQEYEEIENGGAL